jgi:myosin-5
MHVWLQFKQVRLCLQRTRRAMTNVGIPEDEQDAVFQAVAAVLHLGNVNFREGGDGESSDLADEKALHHVQAAARLLGCDAEGLFRALSTRTRHTHDGTGFVRHRGAHGLGKLTKA